MEVIDCGNYTYIGKYTRTANFNNPYIEIKIQFEKVSHGLEIVSRFDGIPNDFIVTIKDIIQSLMDYNRVSFGIRATILNMQYDKKYSNTHDLIVVHNVMLKYLYDNNSILQYFEKLYYGKNIKRKYIDFPYNMNLDISKQTDLLKEDLIQIDYQNGLTLDVGYYPEFDLQNGNFRITLIHNLDWENSLTYSTKDIYILNDILTNLVYKIQWGWNFKMISNHSEKVYIGHYDKPYSSLCRYAHVEFTFETSKKDFEFVNHLTKDIPNDFLEGILEAFNIIMIAHKISNVKVNLWDFTYRNNDSTKMCFKIATSIAFKSYCLDNNLWCNFDT